MNNIPFIDILILAMIAVFIINRLRNVLGKKTGNESEIVKRFTVTKTTPFKESTPDEIKNTSSNQKLSDKDLPKLHSNKKINEALGKLLRHNSEFTLESFLDGAKKAFEFILTSYSNNKIDSLKSLVSKDMLEVFSSEIRERKKRKETLNITLIGIEKPEIKNAKVYNKNFIKITLMFITEQVQTTTNQDGEVIDGDSNQILKINELWTFSKNFTNTDPNWTLETIEET